MAKQEKLEPKVACPLIFECYHRRILIDLGYTSVLLERDKDLYIGDYERCGYIACRLNKRLEE